MDGFGYLEVVSTKNDCINLIKHHYLSSVVSFYLLHTYMYIVHTHIYKHITRARGAGISRVALATCLVPTAHPILYYGYRKVLNQK